MIYNHSLTYNASLQRDLGRLGDKNIAERKKCVQCNKNVFVPFSNIASSIISNLYDLCNNITHVQSSPLKIAQYFSNMNVCSDGKEQKLGVLRLKLVVLHDIEEV